MLSTNTSVPIDMLPIVDTVTIYEDISKPYLLCDIAVRDGMGFRELAPLVGEEFIAIEAETKGFETSSQRSHHPGTGDENDLDNIIRKIFRVDSVSPIGNVTDRYKIYVIHCISLEAVISEKKKISKGYEKAKIDFIVKDIYQNYIANPLKQHYSTNMIPLQGHSKFFKPKTLWIEPTEDLFDFCFPFSSPFDIISDLAEKAEAATPEEVEDNIDPELDGPTDGALYMFYETLTQFKFESLESSFKRKPKRTFFSQINASFDPGGDDKYMGRGDPGTQFNNVEEFQIDSLFNVIANLRQGMYASKLITHDITRMRYDLIGYRYTGLRDEMLKAYDVIMTAEKNYPGDEAFEAAKKKLLDLTQSLGKGKLCSPRHDCLLDDGGEGSRIKLTGTNFNHDYYFAQNRKATGQGTNTKPVGADPGLKPANLERRTQKRDSQLQQLDNIKVTLKINGDSSLRVGDLIEMKMPSTVDTDWDYDTWLKGKYMMTKIKHVFNDERYTQEIQIRKDGFDVLLPAADELRHVLADADNSAISTEARIGELNAAHAGFVSQHRGQITAGDLKDQTAVEANLSGGPYFDLTERQYTPEELGSDGKPIGEYFNSRAAARAEYNKRSGIEG